MPAGDLVGSKAARVLAAIRSGASTVREVEAVLPEGLLTCKGIAAHVSNLRLAGRIRRVGMRRFLEDGRTVLVAEYRATDGD